MPGSIPASATVDELAPAAQRPGGWLRPVLDFTRQRPLGAIGALIILFMVVLAAGAGWLAPYDPLETDYGAMLAAPSAGQLGVSDQQEDQDSQHGDEEDRQEPRHRRCGPTVAGNHDDGEHAHAEVDDDIDEHEPPRPVVDVEHHTPARSPGISVAAAAQFERNRAISVDARAGCGERV